jgi:uncharacterized lipoprotein YajG
VTVRPPLRPAALVAVAAALVLTGCAGTDSSDASSSTPPSASMTATATATTSPAAGTTAAEGQRIEVQLAGGQVTGDTGRVTVAAGEHVTLVVTSDAPDEVHVHGYDLEAELSPGQPAELSFDATIPGVFEVELHEAGTLLLSLQVQ